MTQPLGIMAWLRKSVFGATPAPQPRMKVINITRQTVLATNLEVANDGPTRNKGLLGRTGLAEGEGLWIIPCEAVHTIGMKFPIDLIYLDRKQSVRKMKSNVPAWRFSVCFTAHSILELPVGTISATKTTKADVVEFLPADVFTG
jgi:uncharacterized membrane protein (UPF0127 family)